MKSKIRILRAGPQITIQDVGRFNQLEFGISASGIMDRKGFYYGVNLLGLSENNAIEITTSGIDFHYEGQNIKAAFSGADFSLYINGKKEKWNNYYNIKNNSKIEIKPGKWGNYGYVQFAKEIKIRPVLASVSTNIIAGIGGIDGRALRKGDIIYLEDENKIENKQKKQKEKIKIPQQRENNIFRFIWGLHQNIFPKQILDNFCQKPFLISANLNRMGVQLIDKEGVFSDFTQLSLVSEPVVVGDIQILGDGTPIILMRDHQPSGGYPRIGTIISSDIDDFLQMRPKSEIYFRPITLEYAQSLLKEI